MLILNPLFFWFKASNKIIFELAIHHHDILIDIEYLFIGQNQILIWQPLLDKGIGLDEDHETGQEPDNDEAGETYQDIPDFEVFTIFNKEIEVVDNFH